MYDCIPSVYSLFFSDLCGVMEQWVADLDDRGHAELRFGVYFDQHLHYCPGGGDGRTKCQKGSLVPRHNVLAAL